jgi:hypothetical protein
MDDRNFSRCPYDVVTKTQGDTGGLLGTVSEAITTDGTIGQLLPSNILNWTITVVDGPPRMFS